MKYKLMSLAIILWQHATIVYSCTDLQSGRLAVIGTLHRHTSEIFAILPWAPKVRSYLRSMEQGWVLFVPFARTSTHQTRSFSVVGPSVWNGLPLALRLLPRVHSDAFISSLRTALFSRVRVV